MQDSLCYVLYMLDVSIMDAGCFCLVKFNFPTLHTLNFPTHRTLRTWHVSYVKFHINLSERILNLQFNGVSISMWFCGFCSGQLWCLPKKLLELGQIEATISLVPIHHSSSAGWVNCSGVHLIIQIVCENSASLFKLYHSHYIRTTLSCWFDTARYFFVVACCHFSLYW
jgi:hypothetical protein